MLNFVSTKSTNDMQRLINLSHGLASHASLFISSTILAGLFLRQDKKEADAPLSQGA